MKKKIEKLIVHEDIGHIYHYTLRQQSFDETIRKLTESKIKYEKEGYFDFSLWFNCGEDANYICISAKRYETDLEYDERIKNHEEIKKATKEYELQHDKETYRKLMKKYPNGTLKK